MKKRVQKNQNFGYCVQEISLSSQKVYL